MSLSLDDGSQVFKHSEISREAINYFQSLFFAPNSPSFPELDMLSFVNKQISQDSSDELVREVSPQEIKEVIFNMKPDKAPRPDGYNAFFF